MTSLEKKQALVKILVIKKEKDIKPLQV